MCGAENSFFSSYIQSTNVCVGGWMVRWWVDKYIKFGAKENNNNNSE